jgi:hypothetical protein
MLEAVDSCRVAIRERYLQSIIAHRLSAFRGHAWLEHWQLNGRNGRGSQARLLLSLVIAQRARTQIAKIRERVVTYVPVRPRNVNAFSGRDAYLYIGWFFTDILRYRHPVNSNRDGRYANERDSSGLEGSDFRADMSEDGQGTHRCAGRARG